VAPAVAPDAGVATLTISGSGLLAGATARLTRLGEPDIAGTDVIVAPGGASLTAAFDLRGHTTGAWNVIVANPDGVSAGLPGAFTIGRIPSVTAISPVFGLDQQATPVTITGSGFVAGLSVRLQQPSSPPIIGGISSIDPGGTVVTATFDLKDKALGFYDVIVANPGPFEGTLSNGFEIRPAPRIDSVTPVVSNRANTVTLVISGVHFDPGVTAALADRTAEHPRYERRD
jgi:hypothetical protein